MSVRVAQMPMYGAADDDTDSLQSHGPVVSAPLTSSEGNVSSDDMPTSFGRTQTGQMIRRHGHSTGEGGDFATTKPDGHSQALAPTHGQPSVHSIHVHPDEHSRHVSFAEQALHNSYQRPSKVAQLFKRFRRGCCKAFCCCFLRRPQSTPVEKIRYVTADGVEISTSESGKSEDMADYGYGSEPSYYSYDNDGREREATQIRRCCRREYFGVKVRHWTSLSIFFLLGLGVSIYLWISRTAVAADLVKERFGKLCHDRVILSGAALRDSIQVVEVISEVSEHILGSQKLASISSAQAASLLQHFRYERSIFSHTSFTTSASVGDTLSSFGVIAFVTRAERAAFEAIHGNITAFRADLGKLVYAPDDDLLAPMLIADGVLPVGLAHLNMFSIPYFKQSFTRMQLAGRTQFSVPFYVANYTATPFFGSLPAEFHQEPGTEKLIGSGVLSASSGYRSFSLTPVHMVNFTTISANDALSMKSGRLQLDLTLLSGVVLCGWDFTNLLQMSLVSDSALDAVIDVFHWPDATGGTVGDGEDEQIIPKDAGRLYHAYQYNQPSTPPFNRYYEDHPLTSTALSDISFSYIDADELDLSLATGSLYEVSFSPAIVYAGLPWFARCTPTTSYIDHNHDYSADVIGALAFAAVCVFTIFLYLQLRYLTAKEREVRFKNQVLTELQFEREKAEQAANAKTDFMAFLCHELRNPLHAVLSMSDSLKETTLDADQSESVFTIHASSELMLAITNDILDLSKIEAGRIELETLPVDVTALVHSLVRGNRSWAAEKGVTVVGIVDPRIAECNYIYADPTRLNQMLTNLMSNSIKFTTKHGQVTVLVTIADGNTSGGQNERSLLELVDHDVNMFQQIGLDAQQPKQLLAGTSQHGSGAGSGHYHPISAGISANTSTDSSLSADMVCHPAMLPAQHSTTPPYDSVQNVSPSGPSEHTTTGPQQNVQNVSPPPPPVSASTPARLSTSGPAGGAPISALPARLRANPTKTPVVQFLTAPGGGSPQQQHAPVSSSSTSPPESPPPAKRIPSLEANASGGASTDPSQSLPTSPTHAQQVAGSQDRPLFRSHTHDLSNNGLTDVAELLNTQAADLAAAGSGTYRAGSGDMEAVSPSHAATHRGTPPTHPQHASTGCGTVPPLLPMHSAGNLFTSSAQRISSSRAIATFSTGSTGTSPRLSGVQPEGRTGVCTTSTGGCGSAGGPNKRRTTHNAASPNATPLFGSSSPLSHAPAALAATLPLLLLNRHRRAEQGSSPRLFGPSSCGTNQGNDRSSGYGGESAQPHPLSQNSHTAISSNRESPPPIRMVERRRNHSQTFDPSTGGMANLGLRNGSQQMNDPNGLPGQTGAAMTPPLSAVADASASHRAQRPSISSRGVIRASSARNLVACGNTNQSTLTLPPQPGSSVQNSPLFHPSPSPSALSTGAPEKSVSRTPQASRQQSTHGPAAMLAEEAEEISRTHGQLGSVRLMFTVQDTGIGIPAEYMSALFEPYSQAKRSITRSHGGTGLGLAIVKRLGDLMNGEITVESEVGVGTSFSFTADFLLAKVPTPAMASMLRHIQPSGDDDIGQVRYANYATLKIAGEANPTGLEGSELIGMPRDAPPTLAPVPLSAPPASPAIAGSSTHPFGVNEMRDFQMPRRPDGDRLSSGLTQSGEFSGNQMVIRHGIAHQHSDSLSANSATTPRMTTVAAPPPSAVSPPIKPPRLVPSQLDPILMVGGATVLPPIIGVSHVSVGSDPAIPPAIAELPSPSVLDDSDVMVVPAFPSLLQRGQSEGVIQSGLMSPPIMEPEDVALLSPTPEAVVMATPTGSATPVPPNHNKPWVLVVDDAQINRKILLKMLSSDYQVDQAENGLQAVEMIDANPFKYSVVLMDLMMPVMSGTEAMQQIRSRGHASLAVIAVTANSMASDINSCLAIGFNSFLSKPCRKETVRSIVKQYVQQRELDMAFSDTCPLPPNPKRSPQKRTVLPSPIPSGTTPILSSSNGQIVASLSPLPPGLTSGTTLTTDAAGRSASISSRSDTPTKERTSLTPQPNSSSLLPLISSTSGTSPNDGTRSIEQPKRTHITIKTVKDTQAATQTQSKP